jgi:hypothetical protein
MKKIWCVLQIFRSSKLITYFCMLNIEMRLLFSLQPLFSLEFSGFRKD